MSNSILYHGSICITDIIAKLKEKHSAFSKSDKNDKIYGNITVWVNDEPNAKGNHVSLMLNSKKENREAEGKCYIGNAKLSEPKEQDVTDKDVQQLGNLDEVTW